MKETILAQNDRSINRLIVERYVPLSPEKWQKLNEWIDRYALGAFVLWALWVSFEYWGLGDLSYVRVHDNGDAHIPFLYWLTQSASKFFTETLLPVGCNFDSIANRGWLSTIQLPFLFLPKWLAFGLLAFAQRFVAGYFTFRFCRDCLKTSAIVAFIAGMVYSLAPTLVGEFKYANHFDEPGFPLLLWFFCRLPLSSLKKSLWQSALIGVILGWGMTLILGLPFMTVSALLFASIYREDLTSFQNWRRFLVSFAVFGFVSVLIHVPQIWAGLLNGPLSHRADWGFTTFDHWGLGGFLRYRWEFILQWWAAFILMLVWLFHSRLRGRTNRAVFAILFAGAVAAPLFVPLAPWIKPHLGFLGGFHFRYLEHIAPFAIICAAALGLEALSKWLVQIRNQTRLHHYSLNCAVVVSTLLLAAVFGYSLEYKRRHLELSRASGHNWRFLYDNWELKKLADEIKGKPIRAVAVGAANGRGIHPGYLQANGIETADGYLNIYSQRYQDFWAQVIKPLADQNAAVKSQFEEYGNRIYLFDFRTHSKRDSYTWHTDYYEDAFPEIPFEQWYNLDLLSLANVKYLASAKPINDSRLILLPKAFTDDMLQEWQSRPAKEKVLGYLRGENPGMSYYVYENPDAFARFFLVGEAKVFDDRKQLIEMIGAATLAELRTQAYLETGTLDAPALASLKPGAAEVNVISYEIDEIELEVFASEKMILIGSNVYSPYWRCTIDGQEADVFPANLAFLGIHIQAGAHRIKLFYDPPYAIFQR